MTLRRPDREPRSRGHYIMAYRRVWAWPYGLWGPPLDPTPMDGATTTTAVRTPVADRWVSRCCPVRSQSTHLAYAVRALLRTAYGGRRGGRRPSYAVNCWGGRPPYAVTGPNCVHSARTQLLVRTAYIGGRLVGTLGGLSDTSHVRSSACRLHLVNDVLWISSPFLWDHAGIEADLAFE